MEPVNSQVCKVLVQTARCRRGRAAWRDRALQGVVLLQRTPAAGQYSSPVHGEHIRRHGRCRTSSSSSRSSSSMPCGRPEHVRRDQLQRSAGGAFSAISSATHVKQDWLLCRCSSGHAEEGCTSQRLALDAAGLAMCWVQTVHASKAPSSVSAQPFLAALHTPPHTKRLRHAG